MSPDLEPFANAMIEPYLVDTLSDSWRWWAVPACAIGLNLLVPRIIALRAAIRDDRMTPEMVMPADMRLGAFVGAAIFMAATMLAGLVLPLGTDNRVAGFTRDTLAFRSIFALVWLGLGSAAWIIAATLAPRWKFIALASVFCWIAAWVATSRMEGMGL